jgi:hypothetical protein
MKQINNYILEKLHLNKNLKVDNRDTENLVFVVAYGNVYDQLLSDFADVKVVSKAGDPDGFIIPIDDAKEIYKQYYKQNIIIYKLPEEYEIIDFRDAYKEGEITLEDLKKIKVK